MGNKMARETEMVEKKTRAERIPLGVQKLQLNANSKPGFYRRFINDSPGRIDQAILGGYNFVYNDDEDLSKNNIASGNKDLGTKVCKVVDKGLGLLAYLMEIDIEFYEEDQRVKSEKRRIAERNVIGNAVRSLDNGVCNPEWISVTR